MNTKIVRFGTLVVLCLVLGIALVPPVQAQDDASVKICKRIGQIQFHNRDSGFKLFARCLGRIEWTVRLVGDVVVSDDTFLTLTIANENNTVFDSTISISNDDELVQRELLLKTKHNDRIWVSFHRER
jgi:hypothetical protein